MNSKLSFTFRHRRQRSAKKFDFNRQKKKSKIEFTINENVYVNSFQSLHRFYDFDKIFTFEKKSSSKFASFISKFVFKPPTKKNKNKKKTTRIVLNKKSTIAETVRSNENFTTDIIETLNIKNCFCTIVLKIFSELWMKNVITTAFDDDFETTKLLLTAYIDSKWKNDICFEHC